MTKRVHPRQHKLLPNQCLQVYLSPLIFHLGLIAILLKDLACEVRVCHPPAFTSQAYLPQGVSGRGVWLCPSSLSYSCVDHRTAAIPGRPRGPPATSVCVSELLHVAFATDRRDGAEQMDQTLGLGRTFCSHRGASDTAEQESSSSLSERLTVGQCMLILPKNRNCTEPESLLDRDASGIFISVQIMAYLGHCGPTAHPAAAKLDGESTSAPGSRSLGKSKHSPCDSVDNTGVQTWL